MPNNTDKPARPSGADYPVDPEERSHQEARLKRAAAAGASASKSPIPGLRLQPSGSDPQSQKTAEAQTALAEPAPPTQIAPETGEVQDAPPIRNDEILAELRKISAWTDLQRRITKGSLICLAVLVPAAIGGFILFDRQLETKGESSLAPQRSDWYDVDRAVRQGDLEKAIALGEELILKPPQYPEAHERLARAYLAAGNLDKAKEHYAEAFRLFPSEENEKRLSAIEKRVNADKP